MPLTAFFFLYLVINVVILPALGHPLGYPLWLLIPTLVFLAAPMLNDWLTYGRVWKLGKTLGYTGLVMCLYGSVFLTSLRSSLGALLGGAVFLVTPKTAGVVTPVSAIRANVPEIVFSVLLLSLTLSFDKSALPCILLVVTGLSGTGLTLMGYKKSQEKTLPVPTLTVEEA